MQESSSRLLEMIAFWSVRFESLEPDEWIVKPETTKWSKKEELGHLIDSAMINLHRFVESQYAPEQKTLYAQNNWVQLQNYQSANVSELILLWTLLNRQLARVWSHMPLHEEQLITFIPTPITLSDLADDYLLHMRHHLIKICQEA